MAASASEPGSRSPRRPRGWTLHSIPAIEDAPPPGDAEAAGEPAAAVDIADLRGRVIGGAVELVELLSFGELGSVYLGHHRASRQPVVVKLLAPAIAASELAVGRLRRRAQAMMQARHPHIAAVLAEGVEADGLRYVVMEHVPGHNLHYMMQGDPRLAWPGIYMVAVQIAEALAALHAVGVVHGAVSPGNLVSVDGPEVRVMLVDLDTNLSTEPGASLLGLQLGTAGYMAPGVDPSVVDERADVFALAAVIYEMCAGRLPYAGDPTQPEPIHVANPQAPVTPAFAWAIQKAVGRDPAARPDSAHALLSLLRAAGPSSEELAAAQARAAKESLAAPEAEPTVEAAGMSAFAFAGADEPASAELDEPPAFGSDEPPAFAAVSTSAPDDPWADAIADAAEAGKLASAIDAALSVTPPPAAAGASASAPIAKVPERIDSAAWEPALERFEIGVDQPPSASLQIVEASGTSGPARAEVSVDDETPWETRRVEVVDLRKTELSMVKPRPAERRTWVVGVGLAAAALLVLLVGLQLRGGPGPAPRSEAAQAVVDPAESRRPESTSLGSSTLARVAEPTPSAEEPVEPTPTPTPPPVAEEAPPVQADEAVVVDDEEPTQAPSGTLPEQLSAADFRKALLRANRSAVVGSCYERFGAEDVEVVATVGANGRVQKVRTPATPLGDCLRRAVRQLEFPRASKQAQHVFVFHDPRSGK